MICLIKQVYIFIQGHQCICYVILDFVNWHDDHQDHDIFDWKPLFPLYEKGVYLKEHVHQVNGSKHDHDDRGYFHWQVYPTFESFRFQFLIKEVERWLHNDPEREKLLKVEWVLYALNDLVRVLILLFILQLNLNSLESEQINDVYQVNEIRYSTECIRVLGYLIVIQDLCKGRCELNNHLEVRITDVEYYQALCQLPQQVLRSLQDITSAAKLNDKA